MNEEWAKVKAVRRDRGIHIRGMYQPNTEKPKNIIKTLKYLLGTLSGKKTVIFFTLLLTAIGSLATVIGTALLKPLINDLTSGAGIARLAQSLLIMIAVYVIGILSTYLSSRMMIVIAQKTTNHIRSKLFNHLQNLPLKYFDSHAHGDIMIRFTNDVENIGMGLEQSLPQTITSLLTIIGTFIMMLVLSPILTAFIVFMLLSMFIIVKKIGRKSARFYREQQQSLGELNGFIEEMIEGQKIIKIFNHENKTCEEFSIKNEGLRKASTNAQTFSGMLGPILGNISYINYAITAMTGAILSINGQMDIGTIAAFLQYTRSFAQPITQVANQINMLLAALAGAERIFDVMNEPIEADKGNTTLVLARRIFQNGYESLPDDPFADFYHSFSVNAADNLVENDSKRNGFTGKVKHYGDCLLAWQSMQQDGTSQMTEVRGDIRFKNVTFSYIQKATVLNDISLFAKPGQKIALVGSTGAGKTTITNLINRFYDIEEGFISYDGIDIRDIRKSDLRRTLGMVLQDVHLFRGTIRDNIRYGKLDATDEEIIHAAKTANAHSFITRLPDGYDSVLAPDGTNLSQGQRQLISIARAAVSNPLVLIMDEATSSIDTHTERLIENGMNQLMLGRTTFIIAHRLSTVRNADAIVVLEHGKIIERGSHNDLLDLHGRYYQLYTGITELE